MEDYKLKVCTFADTDGQPVILSATGHFASVEEERLQTDIWPMEVRR